MKRIGMLTSGGDCQALNATMRGVVKGLYNMLGSEVEIYGFEDGYKGLIYSKFRMLTARDFSGILTQGGTILGTSRQPFKLMRTPGEDGVDKVDISKVHAVTNMFNAFNGINKSENIINKFTESVKDFTETCKNLMDAMSDNTNAINNIENIGSNSSTTKEIKETNIIEKSSNGDDNKTGGIRISNVDEIAKTIAEKINGALSLDIPDTQIQLLINGTGGNEWIITRY